MTVSEFHEEAKRLGYVVTDKRSQECLMAYLSFADDGKILRRVVSILDVYDGTFPPEKIKQALKAYVFMDGVDGLLEYMDGGDDALVDYVNQL